AGDQFRRPGNRLRPRTGPHDDTEAKTRPIPPLFAQDRSAYGTAAEPRHLRIPCGGREARTRGSIFQTRRPLKPARIGARLHSTTRTDVSFAQPRSAGAAASPPQ